MKFLDSAVWDSKIYTEGWTAGSADPVDILEPATGAVLGQAGMASADDVYSGATRAAKAQKEWAAKKPAERAAVLRRAGELFEEHVEELNHYIQRKTGARRAHELA